MLGFPHEAREGIQWESHIPEECKESQRWPQVPKNAFYNRKQGQ